jgi:hypothetical protein
MKTNYLYKATSGTAVKVRRHAASTAHDRADGSKQVSLRPACSFSPAPVALLIVLVVCSCASAFADPIIMKFLPPSDFGHLNQRDTKCDKWGCGSTAVTNSFEYLQKRYPTVYGKTLVGAGQAGEIATANALADLMFSTDSTPTTWENFIYGKEDYMNSKDPKKNVFSAESWEGWDPNKAHNRPNPDPGAISTNTIPTPQYIIDQLKHNRDVEILIEDTGLTQGHYVTVTGMSWDEGNNKGVIAFDDPYNDDKTKPAEDKLRSMKLTDGFLSWVGTTGKTYEIKTAVSEGPSSGALPEPSSLLLMGSGVLCLTGFLRKRLLTRS